MTDPLIDAILAAPEDDAPRLAWAEREGGERGELVVVQCRLARGRLSEAERAELEKRERQLLVWGPKLAGLDRDQGTATFVRGFVEALRIDLKHFDWHVEAIFALAPVLRRLELDPFAEDANLYSSPTIDDAWAAARDVFESAFARVPPGASARSACRRR